MARILFFLLCLIIGESVIAQSTFIPQNLGDRINSVYDEINPVITGDRKTLFFGRVSHPGNGRDGKNTDIWYAEWEGLGWSQAKRHPVFNIGKRNIPLSVTSDGTKMLIAQDGALALSERIDNQWSAPVKLEIKATTDAALSPDGNSLIYVKGGKLFLLTRTADGKWQEAVQLEGLPKLSSPYIDNNRNIYFTGKRKDRGTDFFRTRITTASVNKCDTPVPFNDTINSALQEIRMTTSPNGAWAYFSSTNNAMGKGDLFMVKLYEDHPYVLVSGKVVNAVSKRALVGKEVNILLNGVAAKHFTFNKDSATYSVQLPFGKQYSIAASADHFQPVACTMDVTQAKEYATVHVDLEQTPKPYVLIKGRLLVKNTNKTIPAAAKPVIVVDGEPVDSAFIDTSTGEYSIKLNHGSLYYLQVSAIRFESFPEVVNLNDYDAYEELTIDLQADAEKMAIVSGSILDKHTGKAMAATIPTSVYVDGIGSVTANVDSLTAHYEIRLPLKEAHTIYASAPGYYPVYEIIDMVNEKKEVKISKDLVLVPFERGQSIRLNNVFFEPGKTVLKTSSFPELDRLVSFLNANPAVKIEIGGHTDRTSKISTLNMAKAVAAYLAEKGIAKNRITARGYSATKPVAPNNTPEGKALNRRIEFTVLEK